MARMILPAEMWERLEPLRPPETPARSYGRPPIPNRKALTGILFVLRTGIPWEDFPQEMGCGSGMTCWRRLRDWQKTGVWASIHEALLSALHGADAIDWSRAVVDSSSVRSVFGGKKRVPIPRIAARKGANIMF
jgi:transposase